MADQARILPGVAEPLIDGLHEPRALAFERNGEATLAPLEGDVLRWTDSLVEHHGRCLRIESEQGTGWQAQLVLGALPEQTRFPELGELMFAPPEALPFAVDLSLNARFLPNELALRIARKRSRTPIRSSAPSPTASRARPTSDSRARRRRATCSATCRLRAGHRCCARRSRSRCPLATAPSSSSASKAAAARMARSACTVRSDDQLNLFMQHLPGQRTRVAGYDDTLTTEQVAAMMPTATHSAGSAGGFYLGHTLSGSRRPIRFDLRAGSDGDRNAAILSVGALGLGKTTLDRSLSTRAFCSVLGWSICDPKGDHRFHLLDDVAPHTEV